MWWVCARWSLFAGFYVLKRTIGAARCRVLRIGVDVQQALECRPMGIAAVDGASCAVL